MNAPIRYIDNQRLAYIDEGSGDNVIVALHGHFGRVRYFAPLSQALRDTWRVIALEQRGHGWSAPAAEYSREGYLADIELLLDTLKLDKVVLVGFSLGGINAYQFAARHPERVRALVIEDIGAIAEDDLSFALQIPARFPSVRAVMAYMESLGFGTGVYFLESLVEHPDGWGFRFDSAGMVRSQQALNGDWWADWLATSCPALLLRGGDSPILSQQLADDMAARRPNSKLVTFPGHGHGVLHADTQGYLNAINPFLADVIKE